MVYIRLHSELIDVYLHLSLPRFQFTKKIKNWNSEKVYLVICRCLLIVCGSLWWLAVVCWWFVIENMVLVKTRHHKGLNKNKNLGSSGRKQCIE